MKRSNPLSAVLLAHQFSPLFEQVIQRVSWCDEVIVVTSERIPEMENFCQKLGIQLAFRKFDGFGAQKRYAFSLAKHDWILSVDSDEVVTPELQTEIETLFHTSSIDDFAAFRLFRQMTFLNRPMRFSGTKTFPVRLFHRQRAQMNSNAVHEEIETAGRIGDLKAPLLHFSYDSMEDYLEKFNRYTTLGAQELFRRGKRVSLFSASVRVPFLFLRRYIFQFGFLDGSYGFIWSALSAWYPFIKYIKLRELNRLGKNN